VSSSTEIGLVQDKFFVEIYFTDLVKTNFWLTKEHLAELVIAGQLALLNDYAYFVNGKEFN
jgi:hypothetical protein